MQHVPAADRVARDHRDDRLGAAAHLDLQVEHVQAPDAPARDGVVAEVAVVAADPLVAPRAEGVRAFSAEDDHPDRRVVLCERERLAELEERLRTERIAHLGPVDGDLRDAVAAEPVADVRIVAGGGPGH